MCKAIRFGAFALVLAIGTSVAAADELKCSNSHTAKDGSSSGTELALSTTKDKITRLVFSNFNASGEEGGGYACNLDSADPDASASWSVDDTETTLILTDKSTGHESILNISKLPKGYAIEFESAWSGYCGFGAEFPKRVTVELGKAHCIVVKQ